MGIYYVAPMLGPALGPILGGTLTAGFNWRAIFWFLAVFSGIACLSFLLFFHDTFRQERSLIYQNVLKHRLKEMRDQSMLDSCDAKAPEVRASKMRPEVADVEKHPGEEPAENGVSHTALPVIKLSFKHVDPFSPLMLVVRRWNNVVILVASGKPQGMQGQQDFYLFR